MSDRIVCVGGSAAGLFVASLLARRGASVRLLDGSKRIDPEPRTLIVTDRMRDVIGDAGDRAVVNEIRTFELYANGKVGFLSLARPDLIVERATLIRDLARSAEEAGVEMLLGRRFVGLEPDGAGLRIRAVNGGDSEIRLQAGTVVGADGTASAVARAAGWPRLPTVSLLQAIVRLPEDLAPDTVRVWFVPEETPYFYWLIPDGPDRGALGLIGDASGRTRAALDGFLAKQRLVPLEYQAARVPLYVGWVPVRRRVGSGDVWLVGDAAGQVKVTTVGGVVTGLRGARGAAQAIGSGGRSRELRRLRRELDAHLLIRRALHRFSQDDYCRLLDLLDGQAKSWLAAGSRDDASAVLWQLALARPRLVLLGLRGLLTGGRFRAGVTAATE